jgi:hypothetical protein
MPLTDFGNTYLVNEKTASVKGVAGRLLHTGITSPLTAGFGAMSVASGDMSVGETAGMGLGFAAGDMAARKAGSLTAKGFGKLLPSVASKATAFLPKWVRGVGKFMAGMAGGFAGSEIGMGLGSKVPIYKRAVPGNTTDFNVNTNI